MSAATTVATVRSPFGNVFRTVEMPASGTSFARTAKDLDVIYEI